MTFEDWYIQNEINTYDKTEHECMKMVWNAAIKSAIQEVGSVTGDNTAELQKLVDLLTDK